jgi:hypothetical protein
MRHRRSCVISAYHSVRAGGLAVAVIAFGTQTASAFRLAAQQPPAAPQAAVTPYRSPIIAVVQPPVGSSVTADKPIVVLRFAPGEPDDPLDAASFAIAVDGVDRTALFQVAATEAWGPLALAVSGEQPPIPSGARQVAARICSVRGACGAVTAVVTVTASAVAAPQKPPADRKRSFIDLVLSVARKLLAP